MTAPATEPTVTKVVDLGDGSQFRYFSDGSVLIDTRFGTHELRPAAGDAS